MKLRRNGAEIHYEVFGRGPAVVFAHGLGGNHLSWWQQVAHFAPTRTCVVFARTAAFRRRALCPAQPRPTLTPTISLLWFGKLDLKDVALVAQSMGGWTCLDYALREPKRVARW